MEKMMMGMVVAIVGLMMVGQMVQAMQPAAPPEEPEEPELPPTGKTSLYGVVTDKSTGGALEGVLVTLNSYSGTTDSGGHYGITDIEPGSYTLKFEKEGYGAAVVDITLPEGNVRIDAALVAEIAGFFTFSDVSVEKVVMESATAWETVNFFCTITNPNPTTVTNLLKVMVRFGTDSPRQYWSFELTLEAGRSYSFKWYGNTYGQRDPDAYNGPLVAKRQRVCMQLEDEAGNKSDEGCVTGVST